MKFAVTDEATTSVCGSEVQVSTTEGNAVYISRTETPSTEKLGGGKT